MESNNITIERVHTTGSKINGKKRGIIVKCFNYKDKDAVLNQYSLKQLWKDNLYVIEDYRECTAEIRKYLFEQAKEIRQAGKSAKIVYQKLVVLKINNAT